MEIVIKNNAISTEGRDPSPKRFLAALEMVNKALALPLVGLVVVYQKTLSPDHGPQQVLYPHGFCQFYPSCSEFARLTLLDRGLVGLPRIINRVIACR